MMGEEAPKKLKKKLADRFQLFHGTHKDNIPSFLEGVGRKESVLHEFSIEPTVYLTDNVFGAAMMAHRKGTRICDVAVISFAMKHSSVLKTGSSVTSGLTVRDPAWQHLVKACRFARTTPLKFLEASGKNLGPDFRAKVALFFFSLTRSYFSFFSSSVWSCPLRAALLATHASSQTMNTIPRTPFTR